MTRPRRRHAVVRGLLGLLVGSGGGLITITAVEQLANDGPVGPLQLGNLDFEGYCARQDGMTALLLVSDPYGWRCAGTRSRVWGREDVDPTEVCRWQYGEDTYAVLANPNDVSGWACMRE